MTVSFRKVFLTEFREHGNGLFELLKNLKKTLIQHNKAVNTDKKPKPCIKWYSELADTQPSFIKLKLTTVSYKRINIKTCLFYELLTFICQFRLFIYLFFIQLSFCILFYIHKRRKKVWLLLQLQLTDCCASTREFIKNVCLNIT